MACKGCLEFLLKLLNFLLAIVGLAMIGYGVYLFVEYKNANDDFVTFSPVNGDQSLVAFGRPMLTSVVLSETVFDDLPKAWFIYLFIGIGVSLFVLSCCGCIGTCSRSVCCLSCYSLFLILLILAELGITAFILFDKSWRDQIPSDKTGNFDTIYNFLRENWKIAKWVTVGAVVFEGLLFLLALSVRAVNTPEEYDSDDDYINPRRQIRQPFISHQAVPVTGIPIAPTLDNRPSRKYEYTTYSPSVTHRATQPNEEEKGRCTIM